MARTLPAEARSLSARRLEWPARFAASAPVSGRDLRIDAVRGLALWMIFVDHIAWNGVARLTYRNIGFSDATEIFVFLSGLAAAIVYDRALVEHGWAHAQGRALYRAFQIYVAYLASTLVTFAIVCAASAFTNAAFAPELDFSLLLTRPDIALPAAVGLYYTPYIIAILPGYMILVAAAPLVLLALARRETGTLALSAALWAIAETVPALRIPNLSADGVFGLNPLAWQFLFCIGLAVGRRVYRDSEALQRIPLLYALAWAVIALNFAFSLTLSFGSHLGIDLGRAEAFRSAVADADLSPLRLTHFLAVAYVVATHLSRAAPILAHPVLRPLVASGQNSLEIFSIGVPISVALSLYFMHDSPGKPLQLLCNVAGIAILALAALALRQVKRKKRAAL
jgi:hypothetical protein